MTTRLKRSPLLATTLALALLAALPQAMAQDEHAGHHPQNAPAGQMPQGGMMDHSQMNHGQMMDHGAMDHEQMMKQMHEQHMGQGQMNPGNMPPAKAASSTKDGKNGQ